ncbi:peptide deformylase [Mesoplasma corruscae]|uniref:Peptide deformylase n=1 Tax=Mesoplasma corruscae TaxID=216874 RepID=A0A2S5RHK9_9MOLU|nr:peptide deformylase [Mesoplasma corruscae]PPE06767.1 peptide deformylase [Mesoplasma corruscae]
MKKPNYLLQDELPSNSWLTKDTNKEIIRCVSKKIADPENLSNEEEMTVKRLIDFVVASQDENFNFEGKEDYLRPAVGLAGCQIGKNLDIFYVRFNLKEGKIEEYAMINSTIISSSTRITCLQEGEGCLSVDEDKSGIVPRSWKIVVEGYDWITKKYIQLTLRDYRSIVFQHEMDHINGKLYYDKINKSDPEYTEEDWVIL